MLLYNLVVVAVTLATLGILSRAQECDVETGEEERAPDYPSDEVIEAAYQAKPEVVAEFLARQDENESPPTERRKRQASCPTRYQYFWRLEGCYVIFAFPPFTWPYPVTAVCRDHCSCPRFWELCRPGSYYYRWFLVLCPCNPGWRLKIVWQRVAGSCRCLP